MISHRPRNVCWWHGWLGVWHGWLAVWHGWLAVWHGWLAQPCGRHLFSAVGAALIAAFLMGVVAVPPSARADKAAAALAKYKQPLDQAVDKALAYLAKQQLKNGSFKCPAMPGNTAVTSLSIMAFLAKGYTPEVGPYRGVIDKGIDYVLASQKSNGLLVGEVQSHGPMYSHCISTLMLSEVSGMVAPARQKKIDRVLPKALKLILTAQQVVKKQPLHQGGWRYQANSDDSDISVTGWALMALRSARNSGALVPKKAIDQAVRFVMNCRDVDKSGGFAYQPGSEAGLARTGTALLSLELCGKHGDKATTAAGGWILAHLPQSIGSDWFYYGLYYCSQGMFQLGGKYWQTYAEHVYKMMLKFQQKDGSWPQAAGGEAKAGTCYSTAMSVLAMAVSYRQLPIYQR